MTYKPFRSDSYVATLATIATDKAVGGEVVVKVASVAALERSRSQDFEERAAIIEFDGGLTRDHAEQMAALHAMPLPNGVTEEQRDVVIDAAARFLDRRRSESRSGSSR
jgi:hypothetical protein